MNNIFFSFFLYILLSPGFLKAQDNKDIFNPIIEKIKETTKKLLGSLKVTDDQKKEAGGIFKEMMEYLSELKDSIIDYLPSNLNKKEKNQEIDRHLASRRKIICDILENLHSLINQMSQKKDISDLEAILNQLKERLLEDKLSKEIFEKTMEFIKEKDMGKTLSMANKGSSNPYIQKIMQKTYDLVKWERNFDQLKKEKEFYTGPSKMKKEKSLLNNEIRKRGLNKKLPNDFIEDIIEILTKSITI